MHPPGDARYRPAGPAATRLDYDEALGQPVALAHAGEHARQFPARATGQKARWRGASKPPCRFANSRTTPGDRTTSAPIQREKRCGGGVLYRRTSARQTVVALWRWPEWSSGQAGCDDGPPTDAFLARKH